MISQKYKQLLWVCGQFTWVFLDVNISTLGPRIYILSRFFENSDGCHGDLFYVFFSRLLRQTHPL